MGVQLNRKIPLFNSSFFILFVILPYIKPSSLQLIAPSIDSLFDAWKILSMIIAVGLYLYNKKLSKIILSIGIYEVFLLISTIANSGDYRKALISCATILSFSMFVELAVKNNSKTFFYSIFFIYFVFVFINFILMLIYPNGLAVDNYYGNTYHFLANDNALSPIFIPVMAIICIYSEYQHKSLTPSSIMLLIMIAVTVIITWSATGVMMWFIMMAYILFIYKKIPMPILNMRLYFIAFAVLQVMIVFLRVQDIFAYIIEDILGKNITFTGRTIIWDSATELIKYKPWLGYGVYEGLGLIWYYNKYMYAHNGVLEVLLQGGVITLIAFVAVFLIAGKELYKLRSNPASGIISTGIFSILIGMLMESFANSILLYLLLVCACNISEITTQIENSSKATKTVVYNKRLTKQR